MVRMWDAKRVSRFREGDGLEWECESGVGGRDMSVEEKGEKSGLRKKLFYINSVQCISKVFG